MTLSALLLLAMQVGPNSAAPQQPVIPPELEEQRARTAAAERQDQAQPSRLSGCLQLAASDPDAALANATGWRSNARDDERAQAGHCQGLALVRLGRFAEARDVFASAVAAAAPSNPGYRARLAAMAGNAAMANREPAIAATHFESAVADARAGNQIDLAADLEIDHARALVADDRGTEAVAALDRARQAQPENPRAWLLSATLSRRLNRLGEAQRQIQRAAELASRDPAVGLEAGVIAAMAGRSEDARRSFESVITLAPESDQAERARSYLEQLGPAEEVAD